MSALSHQIKITRKTRKEEQSMGQRGNYSSVEAQAEAEFMNLDCL